MTNAPKIGIIGGGQLAQFLAIAAQQLGLHVHALHSDEKDPVACAVHRSLIGDMKAFSSLMAFAKGVDVLTLENEFIDGYYLSQLQENGIRLYPSAETMVLVQDKFIQKECFSKSFLPVMPFCQVNTESQLGDVAQKWGYPFVLKARRNGYDGKGNVTVGGPEDHRTAWDKLNGDQNPLLAEQFCSYVKELAVMVTRSIQGDTVVYPVVESIQEHHVCHIVKAPADISDQLQQQVCDIALRAVHAVQGVGTMGVEFFLTDSGQVVINEIAPRVHNTGHYTLEACCCSQFENHIRAILGWPLGDPSLVTPAAVMVNLLGTHRASGVVSGVSQALSVSGVHLHLYGKTTCTAGRKMGHLTVLGKSVEDAQKRAMMAAQFIQFGG